MKLITANFKIRTNQQYTQNLEKSSFQLWRGILRGTGKKITGISSGKIQFISPISYHDDYQYKGNLKFTWKQLLFIRAYLEESRISKKHCK